MKENLKTISDISDKEFEEGSLIFSKNGEITSDKGAGKGVRSAFNEHVYRQYSTDTRDLIKFTVFVNKYLGTYISQIDKQKVNILETSINQTIEKLKKLESKHAEEKSQNNGIPESIGKLQKALGIVKQKIKLNKQEPLPLDDVEHYVGLIAANETVTLDNKVSLIKEKLDELRYPPTITIDSKLMSVFRLVEKKEKQIKDINKKIDLIKNLDSPQSQNRLKKLINKKESLQNQSTYTDAKEFLADQQPIIKEYEQNYLSIFKESPNKDYKSFVDELEDIYPNSEDLSYLLANLLLSKPDLEDLTKLKENLDLIATSKQVSSDKKKLACSAINKSKLFEGALASIDSRKEQKKLKLEEQNAVPEAAGWKIGRATGNFLVVGGLAALAYLVPVTAVGLTLAPKFLKAGKDEIVALWNQKTKEEQHEIIQDIKQLAIQIKENPALAAKTIAEDYRGKDKQGKEIVEVSRQLIEIAKKDPGNFNNLIEGLSTIV